MHCITFSKNVVTLMAKFIQTKRKKKPVFHKNKGKNLIFFRDKRGKIPDFDPNGPTPYISDFLVLEYCSSFSKAIITFHIMFVKCELPLQRICPSNGGHYLILFQSYPILIFFLLRKLVDRSKLPSCATLKEY